VYTVGCIVVTTVVGWVTVTVVFTGVAVVTVVATVVGEVVTLVGCVAIVVGEVVTLVCGVITVVWAAVTFSALTGSTMRSIARNTVTDMTDDPRPRDIATVLPAGCAGDFLQNLHCCY
jgi:hypothetical protein